MFGHSKYTRVESDYTRMLSDAYNLIDYNVGNREMYKNIIPHNISKGAGQVNEKK